MSYHISKIPKGKLGKPSKIQEEFLELVDAHKQKCKILEICEITDLVGAILLYQNLPIPNPTKTISFEEFYTSYTNAILILDIETILLATINYATNFNILPEDIIQFSNLTKIAFLSGSR